MSKDDKLLDVGGVMMRYEDLADSMRKIGMYDSFIRRSRSLDELDSSARGHIRDWIADLHKTQDSKQDSIYIHGAAHIDAVHLAAKEILMRGISAYILPAVYLFTPEAINVEMYAQSEVICLQSYCGERRFTIPGDMTKKRSVELKTIRMFESSKRFIVSGLLPLVPGEEWWAEDVTRAAMRKCREIHCPDTEEYTRMVRG